LVAVRINALDADGPTDLEAAMAAHPDVIAYPMATSADQMRALEEALLHWERRVGMELQATEILPVCETALGVVEVRSIASGSSRVRVRCSVRKTSPRTCARNVSKMPLSWTTLDVVSSWSVGPLVSNRSMPLLRSATPRAP
jgi:citrate lyase beta subunit